MLPNRTMLKNVSLLSILMLSLLASQTTVAQTAAKCLRPDGGTFVWGQAPVGCDAQPLGNVQRAERLYKKLIFDRRHTDNRAQLVSYMTAMSATLKKIAADYIRRRQPHVHQAEVNAFERAVEAVATQESLWTHYRIGNDGRLKLMTGDHNQSLGLMQLHESEQSAKGRSRFDIARNILMGVEHFYINWLEASHAHCVANLTEKARAAYSAYNGGPAAICRWQSTGSKWHQNDAGYYHKFSQRPWRQYVHSQSAKPPVDIQCALSGASDCAHQDVSSSQPIDLSKKIVQLNDGRQCFSVDDKTMYCAPDLRTFSCLDAYNPGLAKESIVKISADHPSFKKFEVKEYTDRDALCQASIHDLALPGSFVRVKTALPLLDKPDGKKVGEADSSQIFQVVDYDVNGVSQDLKYRVMTKSGAFWLKAGDVGNRQVEKVDQLSGQEPVARLLPTTGDLIRIHHAGGVNFHADVGIDSHVLGVIKDGTQLTVLNTRTKGGMNERWLQVKWENSTGWIYSGVTAPEPDVAKWVQFEGASTNAASNSKTKTVNVPLPTPRPHIDAPKAAATNSNSLLPKKGQNITMIWKGGVNLRNGPSVDDKVIDAIPQNAKLKYLGTLKGTNQNERWIEVEWSGKKGAMYIGQTDSDVKQRISQ